MNDFDIVIIGAGIAGASLAAELAGHKRVLLLEMESQPGYHATGRSAAFWSETYGGPAIQPLTSASGPFLRNPPADFAQGSFLRKRGALHLGSENDLPVAKNMLTEFASGAVALERMDDVEVKRILPQIRPDWKIGLWEPDCSDIDVAALHASYLRKARRGGVALRCNAALHSADYRSGGWELAFGGGNCRAEVLVNAAGAWADVAASLCDIAPIAVTPYRRTMMQLAVEPVAPAELPLVVGLDNRFYFKPEAGGKLWLSPHDEIASPACDAAPDEIDVAGAIARFQEVVDWPIIRLERRWAGLRSFAADRLPVIGPDPVNPAFFWLAGQGGFGIQTSPAVAKIAASMLRNISQPFVQIDAANYAPDRFR